MPEFASPGPVVQANNSRLGPHRQFLLTDQAPDGIAAPVDGQFFAHARSRLTSSRESRLAQRFLLPFRALSVRTAERWESFGEDLLSADTLFAEQTTYMNGEMDRTPNGRKIMQGSCIPALDALRSGSARRARSRSGRWTQRQCDLIGNIYLLNEHLRKVKKVGHIWQLGEKPLVEAKQTVLLMISPS
jgi:hypothetical protein